ncbi:MAG: TonB family protein [Pseudomonadota bacterium]
MAALSIPVLSIPDLPPLQRMLRVGAAVCLAVLTTALLALLMQRLIAAEDTPYTDSPVRNWVDFVPILPEPEPTVKPIKRQKVPPKPTREPETRPEVVTGGGDIVDIDGGYEPPPVDHGHGPIGGRADGDLLPIVAITPDYPNRAKRQGLEGYVTLEFTVNERGQVRDARVLEAQPQGVFDRAALRAIERFRYRPRVVNGAAQSVEGVRTRLRFTLDS